MVTVYLRLVYQLSLGIISSAGHRQTLPLLTVVLVSQAFAFLAFKEKSSNIHFFLILVNAALNVFGYSVLILLYRHNVRVTFNRKVPVFVKRDVDGQCDWFPFLPSFLAFLDMVRPLEVAFRFLTARFRVLPDVLIIGEVRCGTTSLCQYISELPGCHTPFCMWRHPELDNKETFYFAGHFLGMVSPANYRMCFPLKIAKWFCTKVLGRPFHTFDGCAQYLTSPTAPFLIARAYADAGVDPPIMIACVRDPVSQAISWWRYENAAILWGEGMGLTGWNTELRSRVYPPKQICDTLKQEYLSAFESLYETSTAEKVVQMFPLKGKKIPDEMITWPGGQLSAIGRSGKYYENIIRYERAFEKTFEKNNQESEQHTALRFINVMPLEDIKHETILAKRIEFVFSKRFTPSEMKAIFASVKAGPVRVLRVKSEGNVKEKGIHRNKGTPLLNKEKEPTNDDRRRLTKHFEEDVKRLELLTGREFGWDRQT